MLKNYLSLIKFSHTIFALPFALVGYFLGLDILALPVQWDILFLVLACMVFARSAAMAFNRYLDRDVDAANPRTANREIPAGILSEKRVLGLVVLNTLFFMAAAALIRPLCFFLSPVALLVILGYSYTKRFTSYSHYVLGLGLALAPLGAYLATGAPLSVFPIILMLSVWFWVSGFDIIYALQDADFDQKTGLFSLPSKMGKPQALQISRLSHLLAGACMILFGFLAGREFHYQEIWLWLGIGLFCFFLVYQQLQVKPDDLSRVNLAFFTANGVASVVFFAFYFLARLL